MRFRRLHEPLPKQIQFLKLMTKAISFKALVFTLLATAMYAVSSCSSAPQKEPAKQIGIQLYSVMDAMNQDPQGSLQKLADMGYNVLELVQWGGDPKVFGMPAEDFKAICDSLGFDIISTHSSIQEDPENEEEVMARWRNLFEIQKACGGEYFVIPSYRVGYTTDSIKQMADYFNRVGKIAKEYDLKLGYHNHAREFEKLKDSDDIMWEYLVENTDPDLVCYELDVFWCTKGGKSPVEYLKKYPNRIELLHIKDDFVIGESGEIDFEGIFNQFYDNGMSGYVVELETPKELREQVNADGTPFTKDQINKAKFEAAAKSADYLNTSAFVK